MAFTGDLEHLPIVDVIQLLHSTRKSGILRVRSRKGESQLVFKEGYIVSASHLNNSVRIGTILVNLGMITEEALERALDAQKGSESDRKPLVITLVEQGLVKEQDAYKGLEQLIEMTIVEMLTWKRGTFILDVQPTQAADEYRYYPDKMKLEINVDVQSVLMDSLRIFDEKVRDGELSEDDPADEEEPEPAAQEAPGGGATISADDLGLGDLDETEHTVPKILKKVTVFDPLQTHREKVREYVPRLPAEEQEQLVMFLARLSPGGKDGHEKKPSGRLVFVSSDPFLTYALASVCGHAGLELTSTSSPGSAVTVIEEAVGKGMETIVIFDADDAPSSAPAVETARRQTRERYPGLVVIQLTAPEGPEYSLQPYREGVRATLPRPPRSGCGGFVGGIVDFIETLVSYLKAQVSASENRVSGLSNGFATLRALGEAPEIANTLLQFVGERFERAVTLIVRGNEVVAERGIGIVGTPNRGLSPALGARIPVAPESPLHNVIVSGNCHYGPADDTSLVTHLFTVIGAPAKEPFLLLPLKRGGKTVSLTYADFGRNSPRPVDIDSLVLLADMADLVLENALYRKRQP